MKNIVLMCAGGMSTSIIMKNIRRLPTPRVWSARSPPTPSARLPPSDAMPTASCLGRRLAMPRTRFLPSYLQSHQFLGLGQSFQIIAGVGCARSCYIDAIHLARDGKFEEAEAKIAAVANQGK